MNNQVISDDQGSLIIHRSVGEDPITAKILDFIGENADTGGGRLKMQAFNKKIEADYHFLIDFEASLQSDLSDAAYRKLPSEEQKAFEKDMRELRKIARVCSDAGTVDALVRRNYDHFSVLCAAETKSPFEDHTADTSIELYPYFYDLYFYKGPKME